MKKSIKQNGITLIALVITVIVLLILASISIAMLTGDNGILTQAQNAKKDTQRADVIKQAQTDILAVQVNNDGDISKDQLIEILGKYFIIPDTLPDDLKTLTLTTKAEYGNHKVAVTEIFGEGSGGGSGGNGADKITGIDTSQTNPEAAMPEGATVEEPDGSKGIVIKDSAGNEWVWIEVPKNIYKKATSNNDYANIEADMQEYAKDYRNSIYSDTWYSEEQHGLGETEYNNLKETMLKSVYDNGGFFIGRYEVGTETPRYKTNDELTTPIIKQDKYPYTFVTCTQAQTEAKKLSTGGKTSSLMFGIQWDLVCKFIEEKGQLENGEDITKDMIDKSIDWGNFRDATFKVTRGKYTTEPETLNSWQDASDYEKPASKVLLTTGATTRNRVLNIYDLAGNIEEWTLECAPGAYPPCDFRGCNYCYDGNIYRTLLSQLR